MWASDLVRPNQNPAPATSPPQVSSLASHPVGHTMGSVCQWAGAWHLAAVQLEFPECPSSFPGQLSGTEMAPPAQGFLAHGRGVCSESTVASRHFQRAGTKQSAQKPETFVQKAAFSPQEQACHQPEPGSRGEVPRGGSLQAFSVAHS